MKWIQVFINVVWHWIYAITVDYNKFLCIHMCMCVRGSQKSVRIAQIVRCTGLGVVDASNTCENANRLVWIAFRWWDDCMTTCRHASFVLRWVARLSTSAQHSTIMNNNYCIRGNAPRQWYNSNEVQKWMMTTLWFNGRII